MRYTYQGLKDWAIAQYSMLDTVRKIESTADTHRTTYGANQPVESGLTNNTFPNGLQLEYLLLKDILASDQRRDLHLTNAKQRTCRVEASYDTSATQAPYRLHVRLPYAEQPLEPILSSFAELLPPAQSWIVGTQQPPPSSNHSHINLETLFKRNNQQFLISKKQWEDVSKANPYLKNEGGDGDIYQCTTGTRVIRDLQALPDARSAFNRIVLTTQHGSVTYQYLQVIANLHAETPTPLIAACSVFDSFVERNPQGVDGAPASAQ